ncbi:hypothetical protein [Jidongwangia harbinensis]|uniref:hypothetical protein n=1 Tax=Jidongwangia harbinensis TaxID=2878561 RepID=UPI001CD96A37|nr:hypothetical protein [Jidongwangia harbinensis]MCA2214466.1 hypothetical protein [Jidongwangia harbinensis]
MLSAAVAAPTGFTLAVPPTWFEVDVHPNTRDGSINSLVRQRVRQMPELRTHRTALVRALRGAARTAHAHGAAYCGVMVDGLGGALLTATVTVSVVAAPGEVASVGEYLRPVGRTGDDRPWRVVEQVDLPHVGRVTRTRGVEDVTLPEGAGWIRAALLQTFVPFPGPGQARVALVTGSTPIVALAAEMHDLFDAVTATFRFVPPAP